MDTLDFYPYRCNECGDETVLQLKDADVKRWKNGDLIQRVFPQLSESERELMISGTCGDCFDKLFPEDNE